MANEKMLVEIFADSCLRRFLELFEAQAGISISEQGSADGESAPPAPEYSTLMGLELPLDQPASASFWIGVTEPQAEQVGRLLLRDGEAGDRQPQEALFELLQNSLETAAGAALGKFQVGIPRQTETKTFSQDEAACLLPVRFSGPEIQFELYLGVSPQLQSLAAENSAAKPAQPGAGLDLLFDFELPVSFSFGRKKLALKDVLRLAPSSVVELDRAPDDLVEVIVNDTVIAWGEVVSINGQYGIRIRRIASGGLRSSTVSAGAASRALIPA